MRKSDPPHNLSLFQLTEMFPDEASAEAWLIEQRWGGEVCCPQCGSVSVQARPTRKPQPFRCRDCGKDFSVKTDTLMHSSPLPCRKWVWAIYLFRVNPKGISSVQLARVLGVTQKTAWHMLHRLRENFSKFEQAFSGTVEVDEAHIGGRFKSMHHDKREENRLKPNYGKTVVAGAREQETGRYRASVVPAVTAEVLQGFIAEHVEDGARIYTDDSPAYDSLTNHATVNHSRGQYVDGEVTTNGIESLWALFKRAYWGTWHRVSPKHLQRYLNEITGRLNLRGLDALEQMGEIVRRMDGKRLTLRDLVGAKIPAGG